jgi:DNA-binding FrmR family transcriptional regulator
MKDTDMKYGYTDNKPAIAARLKRAEGQIRGVARMVDEDTYCIDILTQLNAVQAALDKVALELLRDHAGYCLSEVKSADEKTQKINELTRAMERMLSR